MANTQKENNPDADSNYRTLTDKLTKYNKKLRGCPRTYQANPMIWVVHDKIYPTNYFIPM